MMLKRIEIYNRILMKICVDVLKRLLCKLLSATVNIWFLKCGCLCNVTGWQQSRQNFILQAQQCKRLKVKYRNTRSPTLQKHFLTTNHLVTLLNLHAQFITQQPHTFPGNTWTEPGRPNSIGKYKNMDGLLASYNVSEIEYGQISNNSDVHERHAFSNFTMLINNDWQTKL